VLLLSNYSQYYIKMKELTKSVERQVAAENAERSSRMRAEVSKTTRENKEFVRNVERAKMLEGIQSKAATKRKRKRPNKDDDESGGDEDASAVSAPAQERRWTFNQTSLAKKREREEQPEQVKRILSKIF
jgi:ESF2/ABP1 family protein